MGGYTAAGDLSHAAAQNGGAAAHILAHEAGIGGMVGGQQIDLMSEGHQIPLRHCGQWMNTRQGR